MQLACDETFFFLTQFENACPVKESGRHCRERDAPEFTLYLDAVGSILGRQTEQSPNSGRVAFFVKYKWYATSSDNYTGLVVVLPRAALKATKSPNELQQSCVTNTAV